ncbi:CinA family protein [Oceanibaculum pacificum]|uniref:Damage-inducible protein CinA n=1 Tax=Oceanibaculum pacificum TaxID=580166 RepID=A0A154W8F7_9PROT|nr:CinA family protein [Oceanibaculum pacificum]KZD09807.1 damage-inducible protein CinA [Oceanibaculum pacificum]
MIDEALLTQAKALLERCKAAGVMVATAESCTGGLIAATLTEIAGSSAVVDRGFVTYSNEGKIDMLGVPPLLIAEQGAVSEPVARAMAEGALARSAAQVTVAVTGIAGPGGATPTKPVGLVHFAVARTGSKTVAHHEVFPGDRSAVRRATVEKALAMIGEAI